jgi:signal transduction histidine kinase
VQYEIGHQINDSRVINIAGRQRMLSQRLTKAALAAQTTATASKQSDWLRELALVQEQWRSAHTSLQQGGAFIVQEEVGAGQQTVWLPGNNSTAVSLLFNTVEPSHQAMLQAAEQILAQPDNPEITKLAISDILANESLFLSGMEKIVFQYDQEAAQRVQLLRIIESILLASTLTVLLLEGLLIFRPMAARLQQTVAESRDGRIKAETALQHSYERLEDLSRQLIHIQEEERRHLARELHDEIGQRMTAVKIRLQSVNQLKDPQQRAACLTEIMGIVDLTLQQVRSLSLDLRPSLLDDMGLVPTLRWYLDQQAQWGDFIPHFNTNLTRRLPVEMELVCFRVTQESITNVIRYAEAKQVSIRLWQEPDHLVLTIQDDGVGFHIAEALQKGVSGASLGLKGMGERVKLANGRLHIHTAPGQGTCVQLRLQNRIKPMSSGTVSTIHE